MGADLVHEAYHPRWLRRRVSTWWWLQRGSYFAFIVREISSVFVAWFAVYLLLVVVAVRRGDGPYGELLAWSATPGVLLLNAVSLALIVYHAVTWFNLAPQAMVVHVGAKRVPGALIAASNYAAWAAASIAVAWILLGA